MKTIRRIYFYLVALVSLGVVTWAVIGLLRSIFDGGRVGSNSSELAGALALILVGLPVFFVHWWLAQREAAKDPEEHFSGTRAIFLYSTLTFLLVPVVQNLLAIVNRLFALLFKVSRSYSLFGSYQSWSDNIIAIAVNALLAYYFYTILMQDWGAKAQAAELLGTRRVARYAWMLYGLGMSFIALQQLVAYIFELVDAVGVGSSGLLVNGLSLLLVGGVLWAYLWSVLQDSLSVQAEKESQLRLGILYSVSFLAVVITLATSGYVLSEIIRTFLDASRDFSSLLGRLADTISVAIPAALVWAYFGRVLEREVGDLPTAPRRSGMRRLYAYVLSFLGLATTVIGVMVLVLLALELALDSNTVWGSSVQRRLSGSLAALLVGIPVWLRTWLPMSKEARLEDEAGDHARRSVVRKGFLYLVLFVGVMGSMFSAGALLFELLNAVLDQPDRDFQLTVFQLFVTLIVAVVLALYHWLALRSDGQLSASTLTGQHADFSAAVIDPGDGKFAELLVANLRSQVPDMPVAVHRLGESFDDSLINAGAVVLPAGLATAPPEALRLWLGGHAGVRVVVPDDAEDWVWVGLEGDSLEKMSKHAARAVRQLAEGQDIARGGRSLWVVLGYIGGGVVGLMMLCALINLFAMYI